MMTQFKVGFSFYGFGDAFLYEMVPGPYLEPVKDHEGNVRYVNHRLGPKREIRRNFTQIYGNEYLQQYGGHTEGGVEPPPEHVPRSNVVWPIPPKPKKVKVRKKSPTTKSPTMKEHHVLPSNSASI